MTATAYQKPLDQETMTVTQSLTRHRMSEECRLEPKKIKTKECEKRKIIYFCVRNLTTYTAIKCELRSGETTTNYYRQ